MSEAATGGAPTGGEQQSGQQFNAEQSAALQRVESLRGDFLKAPSGDARDKVANEITALQRFAFGHGEKPAGFMPESAKAPDLREHDSLRTMFEDLAKPTTDEVVKGVIDKVVVQGVNRALAEEVAHTCVDLGMSEPHTRAILDCVREHHGATPHGGPDTDFKLVREDEVEELMSKAGQAFGGTDKFEAASERAREFLKAKGVLDEFDRLGLTRSTLAFDARLIHTLNAAADAVGIPRMGK